MTLCVFWLLMLVLLIEDDKVLAASLSDYLLLDGIECDFAYNGQTGLNLAKQNKYDVIVLDIMLPKLNGFTVCQQLRESGINTPVLMMTARDSLNDKLQGFDSGTDDYITKPFAMAELSARLKALSKRRTNCVSNIIQVDDLKLDLNTHKAHRAGNELTLSPLGWKLLVTLAKHSPKVVTKETLQQEVWDDETNANNLKVQMHKLRQSVDKLFTRPLIHSVPRIGFVLRGQSDA